MKNTTAHKIAKILQSYQKEAETLSIDSDELLRYIIDDIAELIEGEDAKSWFYNEAGLLAPEREDEDSIS